MGGVPLYDVALIASGGDGDAMRFAASADALGGAVSAAGRARRGDGSLGERHRRARDARRGPAARCRHRDDHRQRDAEPQRHRASAGIALTGGRYRRTPLDGDVDIVYDGGDLSANGRVDVAGTRADVHGTMSGIAAGAAR